MSLNNIRKRKKVPSPRHLLLWPPAIPPGQYGNYGGDVFLLPNNAKLINDTLSADNTNQKMALAFDSGGYGIEGSASFGSYSYEDIKLTLSAFSPSNERVSEIFFPVSLADDLGVKDGDVIGNWRLKLCHDSLELPSANELTVDMEGQHPIRSSLSLIKRLGYRLKYGGKLLLAYLILFSLPLGVVNWQALLPMLLFTIIAGLLLLFLWEVYPGKSILKGFLHAVLMTVILWLSRDALRAGFDVNVLWIGFVVLTSSVWFSIVYSGIKWNS